MLAATIGLAAEPSITGDTKVSPYKLVRLSLKDAPAKAGVLWRVRGPGAIDFAGPRNKSEIAFVAPPGAYAVEVSIGTVSADGTMSLDAVETAITITGIAPEPGPSPTPPPAPDPSVKTNPFSDESPRVLILWDHEGTPLTAEQTKTMYGLESFNAMKTFAGENFRILTVKATPDDKVFADAVRKGGKSYPWFKVGAGSKGFEGPVRGDKELMSLLDELKPKPKQAAWTVGGATFTPASPTPASPACIPVYQNGRWVTICP